MFILTGHLIGYKKEHVDIKINEDGNRISIIGEKPVQEMVLKRWIMFKKEVEIRGFRKVFRIPQGVILDRIKAKYNEVDSILTIIMLKKERGIRGVLIEEVKEEGAPDEEGTETVLEKPPPAEEGEAAATVETKTKAQELPEEMCAVETPPGDSELLDVEKTPEITEATAEIPEDKKPEREQEPEEIASETKVEHLQTRVEDQEPATEDKSETEIRETTPTIPSNEPNELKETVKEDVPEEKVEREAREAEKKVEASEELPGPLPEIEEEGSSTLNEPENKKREEGIRETEDIQTSQPEVPAEEKDSDKEGTDEMRQETEGTVHVPEVKEGQEAKEKKFDELCSAKEKKRGSKRICAPFVISGSALLVTLIVIVIHYIRARKR